MQFSIYFITKQNYEYPFFLIVVHMLWQYCLQEKEAVYSNDCENDRHISWKIRYFNNCLSPRKVTCASILVTITVWKQTNYF